MGVLLALLCIGLFMGLRGVLYDRVDLQVEVVGGPLTATPVAGASWHRDALFSLSLMGRGRTNYSTEFSPDPDGATIRARLPTRVLGFLSPRMDAVTLGVKGGWITFRRNANFCARPEGRGVTKLEISGVGARPSCVQIAPDATSVEVKIDVTPSNMLLLYNEPGTTVKEGVVQLLPGEEVGFELYDCNNGAEKATALRA